MEDIAVVRKEIFGPQWIENMLLNYSDSNASDIERVISEEHDPQIYQM